VTPGEAQRGRRQLALVGAQITEATVTCTVTATLAPGNSLEIICPSVDAAAGFKTQLLVSLTLPATERNESW